MPKQRIITEGPASRRNPKTIEHTVDFVVVGGGLAGTCAAVQAAREGAKVVLVQDRPVLGGNASSEVRLWGLGATAHMHNNNRWSRESGLIGEILVENLYRNPEGNPILFDLVLLEKVREEPNLTLLLNTAVHRIEKDGDRITAVHAFCSQNQTAYDLRAPLFCDASGDGIVAFQAGGAFRMGAEAEDEFGEKFAPSEEYGYLLGHSIYFYTKDVGYPVEFVPPSWISDDVDRETIWKMFRLDHQGCKLWWIEYGGRLDTVYETETIKWKLWEVVYAIWDRVKNSGQFPEARNLTLEWVGTIPGKRESRRFEGDTMMRQQDVVECRPKDDEIAFGGWSLDLHPADGVFAESGKFCNQLHSKGIYPIPYRSCYSRNVDNLFLAGRIISASHVAFGSTRVMLTCANAAQTLGIAAARCARDGLTPRGLLEAGKLPEVQQAVLRTGAHLPGTKLEGHGDLAPGASPHASSVYRLDTLPAGDDRKRLEQGYGMLLPHPGGPVPEFTVWLDVDEDTELRADLAWAAKPDQYTPDVIAESRTLRLCAGNNQSVRLRFEAENDTPRYLFLLLRPNPAVSVHLSEQRLTGVLAVLHRGTQKNEPDQGVDEFEFWAAPRRPDGKNIALRLDPALDVFHPENVVNGRTRPTRGPNAWLADPADPAPHLSLNWSEARSVKRILLFWDTDFDHAMETALWGHPERAVPFCVHHFRVRDADGNLLHEITDNHQTRTEILFDEPIQTDTLRIELLASHGPVPPALFQVCVYPE